MAEHSEVPIEEITTPPEPAQEESKKEFLGGVLRKENLTNGLKNGLKNFVIDIKEGRDKTIAFTLQLNEVAKKMWEVAKTKGPILEGSLPLIPLIIFEMTREDATGDAWGYVTGTEQNRGFAPEFFSKIPAIENLGNVAEMYAITWVVYHAVSLLTQGKLSREQRLGLSFLMSAGFVVGMETGILPIGTADSADILPGVIGATAFVGVMGLFDNFIRESKKAIEDLKQKIVTIKEKQNGNIVPEGETENLAYALATVPEQPRAPDEFDEQLE